MKVGANEFKRKKQSSLAGGTVITYTSDNERCTFTASRLGVELTGSLSIEDQAQLTEFARLVSEVWSDHRKLVPRLVATITGH